MAAETSGAREPFHTTLYHLVPAALWKAAKAAAPNPYFPPTYQQDGFVHLTADPSMLLSVGNTFYKDSEGDWLLLCLDAEKLTSPVVYEEAAPVGDKATTYTGQLFPHLYGALDFDAVTSEMPVERDCCDGTFLRIQL